MKLRPEEILQAQLINFFENVIKNRLNKEVIIYSNRNESGKGGPIGSRQSINALISGGNYKRMGRVAGVPDISILWKGGNAFIEVKTEAAYFTRTGKVTKNKGLNPAQIGFHERLKSLDIPTFIVYDFDSFEEVFKKLTLI